MSDRDRAAGQVGEHQLRIDTEQLINRGDEIARCDRVIRRVGSDPVAATEDEPLLDGPAKKEREAALRPVVAACGPVDPGAAAHLAHDHDEGRIEQSAVVEILQQRVAI